MGRAILNMSASSDLLWALTRKTNCFMVRRTVGTGGCTLTSEPNNLMNKHSFKYSGLANQEAVGIEDNTRGITLKLKNKKNFRSVAASIKNKTEGKFYRKDLSKAALARWYKVWKSQKQGGASEE